MRDPNSVIWCSKDYLGGGAFEEKTTGTRPSEDTHLKGWIREKLKEFWDHLDQLAIIWEEMRSSGILHLVSLGTIPDYLRSSRSMLKYLESSRAILDHLGCCDFTRDNVRSSVII